MSTRYKEPEWRPTGVVSQTCETRVGPGGAECGEIAVAAYPAMGGGYHSMCRVHVRGHAKYSVSIEAAMRGDVPEMMRPAVQVRPTERAKPLEVGKELRRLRVERGWSQRQVARLVDLSPGTIEVYEAGWGSARATQRILRVLRAATESA